MQNQTTQKQIMELVIARLQVMPPDVSVSIGSEGDFTRDQLIEHVKKHDKLGQKITEIELSYLKMLKEGNFYVQNPLGH